MTAMRYNWLVLLLPVCLISCQSAHGGKPIESVILISIDTLRPDFLGCYDEQRKTTPNIDRFASDSVLFTRATSQAPSTAISHKSILYSLYPSVHQSSTRSVPEEKLKSPLEILRDNGFKTAAFVGGGELDRRFGFGKGFDSYWEGGKYSDSDSKHSLEELEVNVNQWLRSNASEKFFLFVHTYEVHCPYFPPKQYRDATLSWYNGSLDPREKCGDNYYNQRKLSPDDLRYIRELYAGEVEYVDEFLGRLFATLKELNLYDNTLIFFLSDHGESLGERGYVGHNFLYERQLAIPLIAHIPGISGQTNDSPVEAIDVIPTVFHLLALKPPYLFQGDDLLPLIYKKGKNRIDRPVISEQSGRVRVRIRNKVAGFERTGAGPYEVYDLENDPEESNNIATLQPGFVDSCKREYFKMLSLSKGLRAKFVIGNASRPVLDEETIEQLKGLGYLTGR